MGEQETAWTSQTRMSRKKNRVHRQDCLHDEPGVTVCTCGGREATVGEQQSTVRLRRPTLGDTPGIWHLDVTCPACGSPMRPVRCGMDFADFRCSKAKWGPNDTRPDRCHPMQRLTIRWDDTPEGGDSG